MEVRCPGGEYLLKIGMGMIKMLLMFIKIYFSRRPSDKASSRLDCLDPSVGLSMSTSVLLLVSQWGMGIGCASPPSFCPRYPFGQLIIVRSGEFLFLFCVFQGSRPGEMVSIWKFFAGSALGLPFSRSQDVDVWGINR
ncbi:hypothetical protein MRV_0008 [Murine roseolovirus]|uniref:Uncharacterized protein n=1 Tax=Murid betaherpesvirus 3 TaxID=2560603 RepID=A0A1P8VIN6_9BETA|nr:hypothetical protein MRV_0008 [Murine roseolovirus]APZ76219.1 hypothetical protein MRV_0008 [Murid betaherpesvirus 3]